MSETKRISPIAWATRSEEPQLEVVALEDGELVEDSDSDIDYNILPRPATSQLGLPSLGLKPESMEATSVGTNLPASSATELVYSDEEDYIESTTSGTDTEDEQPAFKRVSEILKNPMPPEPFLPVQGPGPVMPTFRNPNSVSHSYGGPVMNPPLTTSREITLCDQKMISFQQKRKVNNIWADVLQEEQHQQTLSKFESIDVDGKRIRVERGPESYTFKREDQGIQRKRKHVSTSNGKRPKRVHFEDDDNSDVSSAALSDDDLAYIRSRKTPRSSNINDHLTKDSFLETSSMTISQIRETLGKLKGRKLAYFMANELQESKTQLIVRACELLGKQYCIELFLKTLKIERKGGLMIKTNTRRRTPGGIFMYMMRKDDKFPLATINDVFELDKQFVLREKRAIRSAKRKEEKARIERYQRELERMQKDAGGNQDSDEDEMSEGPIVVEDGELGSSSGTSSDDDFLAGSDLCESSADDNDEDDEDAGQTNKSNPVADFIDEVSNDYLDIHPGADELNEF